MHWLRSIENLSKGEEGGGEGNVESLICCGTWRCWIYGAVQWIVQEMLDLRKHGRISCLPAKEVVTLLRFKAASPETHKYTPSTAAAAAVLMLNQEKTLKGSYSRLLLLIIYIISHRQRPRLSPRHRLHPHQ